MTRFAVLIALCLFAASAAIPAQATTHDGPAVVTFQRGHFELNGKPFFPVMALLTFCPTADTVNQLVKMGVNVIDGYALSCAGPGGNVSDEVQNLHAVLQNKLLWTEHDTSVGSYPEGLPELADWQVSDLNWDNSDGVHLVRCAPNAITNAYANVKKSVAQGPTVLRITVAKDAGVSQADPACLNGARVNALVSTGLAANVPAVEFVTQSRGNGYNNPSLLFDLPDGLATAISQHLQQFSQKLLPAVVSGKPTPLGRISNNAVKAGAWTYQNKLFILAVNTSPSSVKVNIGGVKKSVMQVAGSGSGVRVSHKMLSDQIGGLTTNVYRGK